MEERQQRCIHCLRLKVEGRKRKKRRIYGKKMKRRKNKFSSSSKFSFKDKCKNIYYKNICIKR